MSGQRLDLLCGGLDGVRLVEASAGTGKTFAVCLLYLRLLLERGFGVHQILVVSFTKAATAELRLLLDTALPQLRFDRAGCGQADQKHHNTKQPRGPAHDDSLYRPPDAACGRSSGTITRYVAPALARVP